MNIDIKRPQASKIAAYRSAYSSPRWAVSRITVLYAAALVLPLALYIHLSRGSDLPLLASTFVIAVAWAMLFAYLRQQKTDWHCIVTPVIVTLMIPPSTPLWQAVLALSFGIVVGEQIFGGRGYGFLSAPVTALAFLLFSFPDSMEVADSRLVAVSVIPGAVVLLITRLISWRILVGFAAGLLCCRAIADFGALLSPMPTSSLALGIVFLICDPVSAASTNAGRWAYGFLAGALVVILAGSGDAIGSVASIVFAALLANIFAPLIDRIVVIINVNRRRRRNG